MSIDTPLESAGTGLGNAGRGPFPIAPGDGPKQIFRVNGALEKGRTHVLSVAIFDEPDYVALVGGGGLSPSPLVGVLRFGQGGATPVDVEIDVRNGVNITVPASFVDFSIRSGVTTGVAGTYTRQAAAWLDEGEIVAVRNATRTFGSNVPVTGVGAVGPVFSVPPFAHGVQLLITDVGGFSFANIGLGQWLDAGGVVVGETSDGLSAQGQSGIPNDAVAIRMESTQAVAINSHRFIFELSF